MYIYIYIYIYVPQAGRGRAILYGRKQAADAPHCICVHTCIYVDIHGLLSTSRGQLLSSTVCQVSSLHRGQLSRWMIAFM